MKNIRRILAMFTFSRRYEFSAVDHIFCDPGMQFWKTAAHSRREYCARCYADAINAREMRAKRALVYLRALERCDTIKFTHNLFKGLNDTLVNTISIINRVADSMKYSSHECQGKKKAAEKKREREGAEREARTNWE